MASASCGPSPSDLISSKVYRCVLKENKRALVFGRRLSVCNSHRMRACRHKSAMLCPGGLGRTYLAYVYVFVLDYVLQVFVMHVVAFAVEEDWGIHHGPLPTRGRQYPSPRQTAAGRFISGRSARQLTFTRFTFLPTSNFLKYLSMLGPILS